jgi:hypothetical protein
MFLSKMGTGGHASGDVAAEAIDFDGANDYLSRSSDLVGNTDGKTFTFSCWVWRAPGDTQSIYESNNGTGPTDDRVQIRSSSNKLDVICRDNTGTPVMIARSVINIPLQTWTHVIISFDLSDTSKRHLCIDDVEDYDAVWDTYSTWATINFPRWKHLIAADDYNATKLKNRLSHLFLAYEYIDLSVEANRRIFITSDRRPAKNQAALNPIMYLPMSDPTQPGLNLGTGGDFALTGVVARSGRGPNQFNAPYSDLDGSADYLSRTSALVGIADGKQVTFAISYSTDSSLNKEVFYLSSSNDVRFYVSVGDYTTQVVAFNSSGLLILHARTQTPSVIGRNYTIVVSFDLENSEKRHLFLNGQEVVQDWYTYTNQNIDLSVSTPKLYIGGPYFNGRLGNVFFDTRYIDLSDPANLAKFCTGTGIDCKPVDMGSNGELPFGTPPLMYLPMYANNAGKNYGTGGDFTVNSGPFVGSRGPNEYWGNKADFDGSTYLGRTSMSLPTGKTFSYSFWINVDSFSTDFAFIIRTSGGIGYFLVDVGYPTSGNITVRSSQFSGSITVGTGSWYHIAVCVDLSDTAKRFIYHNGVLASSSWTSYNNTDIDFTGMTECNIGGESGYQLDGKLSEFYFTTDYIDFSQEANRLKFRDAFGNPVDLTPQIEAGTIPNPAIYMRFDPSNWGRNSGYGGDFTAYGTITDGGQL